MKKRTGSFLFPIFPISIAAALAPVIGNASVESTLMSVQTRLINTILPLAGIVGLVIAALSFVAGHENARGRLMLAIMGAVVGFMAPSIISFIQSVVN